MKSQVAWGVRKARWRHPGVSSSTLYSPMETSQYTSFFKISSYLTVYMKQFLTGKNSRGRKKYCGIIRTAMRRNAAQKHADNKEDVVNELVVRGEHFHETRQFVVSGKYIEFAEKHSCIKMLVIC